MVSDDDPKNVRDIITLDIGTTKDWLSKLTLTASEEIEKIATANPKHVLADATIRKYAAQTSELAEIEVFSSSYN